MDVMPRSSICTFPFPLRLFLSCTFPCRNFASKLIPMLRNIDPELDIYPERSEFIKNVSRKTKTTADRIPRRLNDDVQLGIGSVENAPQRLLPRPDLFKNIPDPCFKCAITMRMRIKDPQVDGHSSGPTILVDYKFALRIPHQASFACRVRLDAEGLGYAVRVKVLGRQSQEYITAGIWIRSSFLCLILLGPVVWCSLVSCRSGWDQGALLQAFQAARKAYRRLVGVGPVCLLFPNHR